jgi:uncharacterized membrane protein (UPF0127 family)
MSPQPRLVRVDNVTRGTTIAGRVRVASSAVDRSVGLLRTPELPAGEGLWIERSPSIHMFFMRYPIDAIFVGADSRVRRISANLRPWRVVLWAIGARDCLEVAAGSADASGTRVGDELRLTELDLTPPVR